MKKLFSILSLVILLIVVFTNCRDLNKEEKPIIDPEERTQGIYILNSGLFYSNNSTLDFYNLSTGSYYSNVFTTVNPDAVLGLGDVGNDLKIYGSKLWAVINGSNKVEILATPQPKRIKSLTIELPRYLAFANGRAYVSSYGRGQGMVYEIDTATLLITRSVAVGYEPEEMAVVDNKLYVANSGGYSLLNYDNRVSVVDLASFTKLYDIEVAPNLHRIRADKNGNLWVSSRGDYDQIPSRLYIVNTKTLEVAKPFDVACSNLALSDDYVYVIGAEFSMQTFETTISYNKIDIKTHQLQSDSFADKTVTDRIVMPNAIAIDPTSGNILISDAVDYVTSGKLYCFSKQGKLLFTHSTGLIPESLAFIVQ